MSNVQPSIDTVPIVLEPGDRSPFDNSVSAGLVGLVYLARQAFEEKRRKQCLEMTNAILKIEPEHSEARTMQDSVRSDLDREFANAKALAKDARAQGDRILYVQATAALRRIVDADPDNLEAQALLHETVAAGYLSPSSPARRGWRGWRGSIVMGSVGVVVVTALAFINGTRSQGSVPPTISTEVSAKSETRSPDSLGWVDVPVDAAGGTPLTADALRVSTTTENSGQALSVAATSPARTPMPLSSPNRVVPSAMGELAVSAGVPVEIYRGEEHLGSTPTTLQLPAGPQTLEYRYQGLRQAATHLITAHGTTTATISFLIKVQINAKPWAQVFLDGVRLTPIGQTPLGDVSVPIGSVLVFQNPGFPDKRYRVTAKDAAIQMNFP